jgi:acyl dehydratase
MTSTPSTASVTEVSRIPLAQATGRRFATIVGVDPVNAVMVRQLLEAMDWDHGRGESFVPLCTYLTFAMPAYRRAGERLRDGCFPPLPYQWVDAPGDGRMAISVEVAAGAPMTYGHHLRSEWYVAAVRPLSTRVGHGTLADFEVRFSDAVTGTQVAVERTSVLYYQNTTTTAPEPIWQCDTVDVVPSYTPSAPRVGQVLDTVTLELTVQRLAMIAAANRDFAPIHVEARAAARIGAPAPVVNTMFVLAVVERLLLHNGGTGARVLRLGPMRLLRPLWAGATVWVRGTVESVIDDGNGCEVTVSVSVGSDQAGMTSRGEAVMRISRTASMGEGDGL